MQYNASHFKAQKQTFETTPCNEKRVAFFSAVLFPFWAPWKHFALKCRRCIALRSCAVKRRNHCHSEAVILLSCVFKFLRGPIFNTLAAGQSLSGLEPGPWRDTSGPLEAGTRTPIRSNLDPWRFTSGPLEVGIGTLEGNLCRLEWADLPHVSSRAKSVWVGTWTLDGHIWTPGGWKVDPNTLESGPLEIHIWTPGGWNRDPGG